MAMLVRVAMITAVAVVLVAMVLIAVNRMVVARMVMAVVLVTTSMILPVMAVVLMTSVMIVPVMAVVLVRTGVIVSVMVVITVMVVAVMAVSVPMVAVVVAAVVRDGARLERPHDRARRAALAAHKLGERRVVLNVEGIRRDLGGGVPAPDAVGGAQQPQRVLGPYLQQPLRGGLHAEETAVVQRQSVAVVQHRLSFELDHDLKAVLAREGSTPKRASFVVEGHCVGNSFGLDGRSANEGGSAKHGGPRNRRFGTAMGSTVLGPGTSRARLRSPALGRHGRGQSGTALAPGAAFARGRRPCTGGIVR